MPKLFIQLPTNPSQAIRNSICGYADALYKKLSTSSIFQVEVPHEELATFKSSLPKVVAMIHEAIYAPNDKLKLKDTPDQTFNFLSYDFTDNNGEIVVNCIVENVGEKEIIEFNRLVRS